MRWALRGDETMETIPTCYRYSGRRRCWRSFKTRASFGYQEASTAKKANAPTFYVTAVFSSDGRLPAFQHFSKAQVAFERFGGGLFFTLYFKNRQYIILTATAAYLLFLNKESESETEPSVGRIL